MTVIEVRLFATMRDAVGRPTVKLSLGPGATVDSALRELEARHEGLTGTLLVDGAVPQSVAVLHNGRLVRESDLDRPLADCDELVVMPPVTGGAGPFSTGSRLP